MSWYQLLDILQQQEAEYRAYADRPPTACPRCGEPLVPEAPGQTGTLRCRYDGWAYPNDWVRPERA